MRKQRQFLLIPVILAIAGMNVHAATVLHWDFNDPALGAAAGAAMPDSDGMTVWREAASDKSGNGNHLTTYEYSWAGFNWTADSFAGDLGMTSTGECCPAAMTWSAQSLPVGIDAETITPTQWTIECLFKSTNLSGNRTMVGRDGNFGGAAAVYFSTRGTSLAIEYRDGNGTGHNLQVAVGLQANTWYHAAGVCDGSTLYLYLNGYLIGTLDVSASTNPALGLGYGTWTLARGMWNEGHVDRFYGVIDEVAISDTALTPATFVVPVVPDYPPVDAISGVVYDAELPVVNGGFTQPGVNSTGTIGVTGWGSHETAWHADTGTRAGSDTGEATDGDGWYWSENCNQDGPIWNITANPMVEGVTYTFTADVQGRWACDLVTMSVIAGSDPNIALASNDIIVANDNNGVYYLGTVSYTATAADAGKMVGVKFQGEDDWMRVDNVHLYTGYEVIHGAADHSPAEGVEVEPGSIDLVWTPSNDPNVVGQELVYHIGALVDHPDIASYLAYATTVPLSAEAGTFNIGTLGYDQGVIWRVDTLIGNGISDPNVYVGESIRFSTLATDEIPVVTAGSGWLTYVGGTMPTLDAVVDDFGEGDVALGGIQWTVDVPWEPTNNTVMQMYDRTADADLVTLQGLGYDPNVLADWIGSDVRDALWTYDPLVLTLSGVPSGTYTWTSLHHDAADQTGPFDVTIVDALGSTTTTGIDVSAGAEMPTEFTATITSNGGDIKLIFDNQGNSNDTLFFVMNSFVLSDGVNPDLAVDFGTPTTPVGAGYQAYTAGHEVAADFVTQSFGALGTTVGVTPTWGPGAAYGATVTVTDATSNPLAPTAAFFADYSGDYTVTLTVTDTDGSMGPQTDTATFVVRVAPDACTGAAVWGGAGFNVYDADEDCDVDMADFAAFAAQWLSDMSLTGPIAE